MRVEGLEEILQADPTLLAEHPQPILQLTDQAVWTLSRRRENIGR